jgi:hypothetical protein
MPSGKEMMNIMNYFSFAYKIERALSNFVMMILWASVSEIFLFLGLFMSFCTAPARIAIALL